MGFCADKELRAVWSSNLLGLVFEKFQEPPRLNLWLRGTMKSNFIPSVGSPIVNIFRPIISLANWGGFLILDESDIFLPDKATLSLHDQLLDFFWIRWNATLCGNFSKDLVQISRTLLSFAVAGLLFTPRCLFLEETIGSCSGGSEEYGWSEYFASEHLYFANNYIMRMWGSNYIYSHYR